MSMLTRIDMLEELKTIEQHIESIEKIKKQMANIVVEGFKDEIYVEILTTIQENQEYLLKLMRRYVTFAYSQQEG